MLNVEDREADEAVATPKGSSQKFHTSVDSVHEVSIHLHPVRFHCWSSAEGGRAKRTAYRVQRNASFNASMLHAILEFISIQ